MQLPSDPHNLLGDRYPSEDPAGYLGAAIYMMRIAETCAAGRELAEAYGDEVHWEGLAPEWYVAQRRMERRVGVVERAAKLLTEIAVGVLETRREMEALCAAGNAVIADGGDASRFRSHITAARKNFDNKMSELTEALFDVDREDEKCLR